MVMLLACDHSATSSSRGNSLMHTEIQDKTAYDRTGLSRTPRIMGTYCIGLPFYYSCVRNYTIVTEFFFAVPYLQLFHTYIIYTLLCTHIYIYIVFASA